MIYYLGILVGSGFVMLFALKIHGILAAVILGICAIATDFIWQSIRIRFMEKTGTTRLVLGIFGGMLLRIGSVLIYLTIGKRWLDSQSFNTYIVFLLTLPLWNIIGMRFTKLGRNH